MKYKLICLDIDGTLLDNEKNLRPRVAEVIRQAAGKGARIVLNSARMPAGVEPIEKKLGIPCIKICDGGSYILDGDKCISTKHFSTASMEEIFQQCAKKNNLNLWIFHDRDWYVTGMDEQIEKEIKIIGYQPKIVRVEELTADWEKEQTGPSKLLIHARPQLINQVKDEMAEKIRLGIWSDISMAKSADFFLEIFPKNIDKGSVLKKVCHILNISLDETAAFGDHEMDIPMIKTAGLGIAMGNAVDDLKRIADYITLSNEEDGVAAALDKMMAGEL